MEEIITREEAKAKGLKHYFTGKPCKHGHTSRRLVSDFSCMSCNIESSARYAAKNRDKVNARAAAHREANRDKVNARAAAYREANRDKVNAISKAYRAANKDKEKAREKAYRSANKDKVRATAKAYYEANKDKANARYAANRAKLTDGYVATTLRIPIKKIPHELLDLKRQQLETLRLERAINSVLKEISK